MSRNATTIRSLVVGVVVQVPSVPLRLSRRRPPASWKRKKGCRPAVRRVSSNQTLDHRRMATRYQIRDTCRRSLATANRVELRSPLAMGTEFGAEVQCSMARTIPLSPVCGAAKTVLADPEFRPATLRPLRNVGPICSGRGGAPMGWAIPTDSMRPLRIRVDYLAVRTKPSNSASPSPWMTPATRICVASL